jgi:hypothetical protein
VVPEGPLAAIAMQAESWLFIFAVISAAVLLFFMVYFIIMFSDLEVDYINPIDLCNKLNMVCICDYRPLTKKRCLYAD